MKLTAMTLVACVTAVAFASAASPAFAQPYFGGFETGLDGWVNVERIPSNTNGIEALEGDWYGGIPAAWTNTAPSGNIFTDWGGYSATFPSGGYATEIAIYLGTSAGHAHDTRLAYTSGINGQDGLFQNEFIFNIGFFDSGVAKSRAGGFVNDVDISAYGSGPRFIVNFGDGGAGFDPFLAERDPFVITQSGWYTFRHTFRDNGAGVLECVGEVLDQTGNSLHAWAPVSDPVDVIDTEVGGNRYGWLIPDIPSNRGANPARTIYDFDKTKIFIDKGRRANIPQPDFRGYFVDVSEWSSLTTPDPVNGIFPIGGGGQVNGNFVVEQKSGVQIGLRASKRRSVPNATPTYRDSEIGVYLADVGFDQNIPVATNRASWNYEIHADLRNATGVYEGKTLDDYDLIFDTDIGNPLFGQPVPRKLEENFPVGGPGAVLLQTSQNPVFGQDPATPFDFNLEKDYFLTLTLVPTTFQAESLEVKIRVDVTDDSSGLPTVDPIGVKSVEPGQGFNRVTLFTIVQDPDSDPLLVEWKVDGVVEQSVAGVTTGSNVEFTFDFPLGSSDVSVEVSDPSNTVSANTTVSVSDAVGPVVVVAANVVVPTDPGQDFATGVVLTEPTVVDAFDGDPMLANDAPAQFPLGNTIVTWTATDASGNVTTATQTVTVEDRESPQIGATPRVVTSVDQGSVFAKFDLEEPTVTDNVEVVSLTNDAPRRFPVGSTQVNWTATDAAGNFAVRTQVVLVKNVAPEADAGSLIRVDANSKSGARVRLDGRDSFDEDGHKLTFSWTANGVSFSNRTSVRPIGKFPVGKTVARVVVTDEVGAKSTDTVTVIVSFDQKLVADTRPFSGYVTPYVDASVSTLGAYATQNPSSDALVYAAAFAEYAKVYDQAANQVRYRDGKLGSQTGVYLSLRNYQVYFSSNAAVYAYLGSGASDGYYHAAAAEYYGQADLDD